MTRRQCAWFLSAALVRAQTPRVAMEREQIVLPDFDATGYILDIGGGCRGTIGRLKGENVVAIDVSMKELERPRLVFSKS